MVREIVFHLGDCKTGSTSIQRTLSAGAVHPGPGAPSLFYPPGVNHIPLASSLFRDKEKAFADRRFASLARELSRSDADIAVISAEAFEYCDPTALARMIDKHLARWKGNIRLISYLRPHAERVVSGFAERTKQGGLDGPMEDFHAMAGRTGLLNYADRLERWRAVFGDAHEVRPMVRSLIRNGDVVQDFVDYVLRGAPFTLGEVPSANESLTTADLAALRLLNREIKAHGSGRIRDARSAFGWNLAAVLSGLPRPEGAEKPRLHVSLAEALVAAYAEDAARTDATFLTGTPLSDALAAAPAAARPEPQPIEPEAFFDPATLRLLQGMGQLLARAISHDPEHFQQALRLSANRPGRRGQGKGKGKGKGRATAADLPGVVLERVRQVRAAAPGRAGSHRLVRRLRSWIRTRIRG